MLLLIYHRHFRSKKWSKISLQHVKLISMIPIACMNLFYLLHQMKDIGMEVDSIFKFIFQKNTI